MAAYSRVTIVPSDGVCIVDGATASGIDMTSLPADLHAVQWYGTWGEEEYIDLDTRKMRDNVRITSFDAYAAVLVSASEQLQAQAEPPPEA
jgi:hypothetical protein